LPCKEPLGFSTQFIQQCIIYEEYEEEEVSKISVNEVLENGIEDPFVEFRLYFDSATATLYFPLFCKKCGEIQQAAISQKDFQEFYQLSRSGPPGNN
jgi:hypothetical protein